jgi:cell wall assembly regulator SMI1
MPGVTDNLEIIRSYLERLDRHEVLARLLPGLRPDDIQRRLTDVGLGVPPDLVDLYAWRNGTRVEPGADLDSVHFFPGFWLLSLDDALTNYVAFRDDPRWAPSWLPVFSNGGGDFYAVNAREAPFHVIGFLIDQPDQPVEYESLAHMAQTLAECFQAGAFFVDDRGYLEMDDQRYAEIARRNNPNVPLWSGQ